MADSKSISQLPIAEDTTASDLVETSIYSALTGGQVSRKNTIGEVGNFIVNEQLYQNELQTTAKTIIGAINEAAQSSGGASWTDVTGTLTAGETSITLSDSSITGDSTIDYYTDVFGVSPTEAEVVTGAVTLTFEAQETDLGVKVRVS